MSAQKVDVLAWIEQATTGLHCLSQDSPAALKGAEVKRAVAELIETNNRVAWHLANAVEFIEKQYPDARYLDRGPIMRNMRRWSDQLSAALARIGGDV